MPDYLKTKYGHININELKFEDIPDEPTEILEPYIHKLYDIDVDNKSSQMFIRTKDNIIISLNKLNEEIDIAKIDYFFCKGSPHKITLPQKLTPKLAYIMGYIYGDGGLKDIQKSYLKTHRFEHKIIIADEFIIQIENVAKLLKEVFNLNTKIRVGKKKEKIGTYYYINPTCKVFYRFLTKIFDMPSGPKANSIKIPKLINNSNKTIKLYFIKGMMDADGDTRTTEKYIQTAKRPSPRIKIKLSSEDMIKDLQKVLNKDFKLGFTGPYSDGLKDYYIQTAKTGMIKSQRIKLFNHPIKSWRLNKFIELMGS